MASFVRVTLKKKKKGELKGYSREGGENSEMKSKMSVLHALIFERKNMILSINWAVLL